MLLCLSTGVCLHAVTLIPFPHVIILLIIMYTYEESLTLDFAFVVKG